MDKFNIIRIGSLYLYTREINMKKLLLLLCVLLPLTGCVMIEENFPELPQKTEENPQMYEEWKEVTFKNLTGNQNLAISRNFENKNRLNILTSDYNKDFLAVVLLATDCEKSRSMAPYLNELATRIVPNIHAMNYVPVFLDIYEDSSNKNISWINDLSNIPSFMNAVTVCSDNACQEVFLPLGDNPSTASIYIVDTRNIKKTKKIFSWNLTDEPQLQAKKMENALAVALGLTTIVFDPSIDDWDDVTANASN